jgi:hypothetical protein
LIPSLTLIVFLTPARRGFALQPILDASGGSTPFSSAAADERAAPLTRYFRALMELPAAVRFECAYDHVGSTDKTSTLCNMPISLETCSLLLGTQK